MASATVSTVSQEEYLRTSYRPDCDWIDERLDDYLAMGTQTVWIVDPRRRRVYQRNSKSLLEVSDLLSVPGTPISLVVKDVFARLDRLEGITA